MPEISQLPINNVQMPSANALTASQNLGALDPSTSLFGDNIVGEVEDTYSSDEAMKTQLKTKAQKLIRQSKNLKTIDEEGNEKINASLKKNIDKQMKELQKEAKELGIELSDIFAEIADETHMTRKQQKELQKNLGIKLPKKSAQDSDVESQSSVKKPNPFGSNFGFGNFTNGFSSTPAPTANPSYSNTPRVKLDQNFLNKTKEISQRIGCNYKDLLAVMNSESGLNSQARNPKGGATGLIQFMPATAKMLGTTTEELRKMTPVQQLDYVEKFFNKVKSTYGFEGKQLSAGDLYALVYMPARAKRDVVASASEGKVYSLNKGLDKDGDGQITKADLQRRVASCYVDESKVFS